jgi:hypothetical protein
MYGLYIYFLLTNNQFIEKLEKLLLNKTGDKKTIHSKTKKVKQTKKKCSLAHGVALPREKKKP